MAVPRLEARNVSKTFGSTTVLDGVELVVLPGEIHALIGQNGSGKSTLVKILTGYHAPDPGMSLEVDGQPLALPVQWPAAQQAGVSVVHQDLGLLDHLSVSENIGVGGFQRSPLSRRIDWKAQEAVAERVLRRLQIPVGPREAVGSLPASRRAGVAIARALRDQVVGGGLMLLDEATRALPREELTRFHGLLRRVVAKGTSVLLVSHNLEEVLALSDRVTVLRDGKVVGSGLDTASLTEHGLAQLMLGRTVESLAGRVSSAADGTPAAVVDGLASPTTGSLSIRVARGEVVGLTGLPGSGFELVPYLISGARRATGGTLRTSLKEVDLRQSDVKTCQAAGVALVPQRRDRDGLAVEMSVRDNLSLPSLAAKGKPWYVARGWQDSLTATAIRDLGIKARSGTTLVKELSGGNQQKVLFAKWLSVEPQLLVLHEPTQAVDVGARADLLKAVGRAAAAGVGVLFVSIEPSDLVEACDRILVVRSGAEPLELRPDDPDDVLHAVYSQTSSAVGGHHE